MLPEKSFKYIFLLVALSVATGCTDRIAGEKNETDLAPDTTVRYSKRFAVARAAGGDTYVYLIGNRNSSDTTAVFHLSRTLPSRIIGPGNYVVHIPCKSIAALSSIYAQAIYELGCLGSLTAIDNADYITNEHVLSAIVGKKLPELAKTPNIDVEQALLLAPDIVFTYGMGDGSGPDARLEQAGIPVAVSVDHLEETPLARAEWIKFFGEFVGRREVADSLFLKTEKGYQANKLRASQYTDRPTVFCEIKYSDAWYMPGGRSYVAALLRDAGADYLWAGDSHAGSLPLTFEEVFKRARDADFWIHLSMIRSKAELLSFERRYASFRAYKEGNLYNNTLFTNSKGYSSYWESGMLHPDRILSDLVSIFHGVQEDAPFYYYEKIR